MSELNWDDARIFLALVRQNTLSAAAQKLNSGAATVSRRVDRLEKAVGVPLFLRHQTGYRLSDQGEAMLPRFEAIEQAMFALDIEASKQAYVSGHVRLACIESLISPFIIPALAPILDQYPSLNIDIVSSANTVNMHRRDADLALRMTRPERGNLRVKRLAMNGFGLYGSPDGSQSKRHVKWPDNDVFSVIVAWANAFGADTAPCLVANSFSAHVTAIKQGVGVSVLPHIVARSAGLTLLHDRLPNGAYMERPIYLVTHADLAASRRIKIVSDCLTQAIKDRREELARP